ncbi:Probable tRNA-dihydrouridine synthase,tRNA-dihydrouridine synthase B,tRNA-dihydrouridine synthase,putative TIM-barrel protein, nifR3 family,Dihydrouridine synthase (Dus) [Chlamydia serpentis]|uniref:tRNA-dihydrouridine synthase n=1 Tax=Chlamydia serpentis TaxID=1967782 RepID=A0A2R8FBW0_9CHLA|nr:tRNA dihydrouridine synthase DusB [Chlamydia serpentis]SPN73883.1 Probable tRNA-dihydrouridine synthase,tRNA-dihydrouridine synthase B,tRNA-dihydrouridine synthase,putative TIM-barrel protein, nifR3 family,Dihydrouridine synthase (Dus) [Chlamydia serpentis]
MASTIFIKNILLRSPIVYAPLAGFSDYPYRQMSALYKPGLMFCEMVKVEGIHYAPKRTLKLLDYNENMRPIGAQLCGSNPETTAEAAKILEGLGFDLIDLNCGCPTDKITKDGSGSGLLKTPDLIGKILEKIINSVSIPVTVKIRSGWDAANINVENTVRIIRDSGASAVFVHGRTRAQGYHGPGNREYVSRAKAAAGRDFLVFGNGDIFSPESAKEMLSTGCDGVLVARGTMGAPWIGKQIQEYLATGSYEKVSFIKRKEAFLQHMHLVEDYYQNEIKFLSETRKLCGHYLVSAAKVRFLRAQLAKASSYQEVYQCVHDYEEPEESSLDTLVKC